MKYLNYILIVFGALVAMYAKVDAKQNQYLLIVGIVFLMMGIYRVSKTISSKQDEGFDHDENHQN